MHVTSGLLDELDAGITLEAAEQQVLAYIRQHLPVARKAPLAGSTVFVDRGFLARDMPELESHMHYRCVDVSGIKELVRRWYPRVYFASPDKIGGHRALADIQESIKELRYYRQTIFVPPPGPDADTASAAGAFRGGRIADGVAPRVGTDRRRQPRRRESAGGYAVSAAVHGAHTWWV